MTLAAKSTSTERKVRQLRQSNGNSLTTPGPHATPKWLSSGATDSPNNGCPVLFPNSGGTSRFLVAVAARVNLAGLDDADVAREPGAH